VALLAAGLAAAPWLTLTSVGIIYVISFGASVLTYRRLKAEAERMHGERDDGAGPTVDEGGDGQSAPPKLRSVE